MFEQDKISNGGGQKLNRITERTSEQFAWRSSKLETRNGEQNYKCWLNNYFFIGETASPPERIAMANLKPTPVEAALSIDLKNWEAHGSRST